MTARRMSSRGVALGLTVALAGTLACADDPEPDPTHSAICVDQTTGLRVDDDRCPEDGGGGSVFKTYYYPYKSSAPAVGKPATGGTFTKPAGSYFGKVPASGGFGTHTGTTGS